MDYPVISADDHIDLRFLPKDLWTDRLPASLSDRAPRVETTEQGPDWVCEGKVMGPWGFYTGRQGSGAVWAIERGGALEEGVLRPTTPQLRLADMDRDGVHASVLYGPTESFLIEERELRRACFRAYNDWLAEFCAASPQRFIGAAQLDERDPEFSAVELARSFEMGLRHANVLGALASPGLYDEAWEPLWSEAEERDVPLASHLVAVVRRDRSAQNTIVESAVRTVFSEQSLVEPFAGLVVSGVLDRHPHLRVVMAESGLAWVPNMIQRLDRWYANASRRGSAPIKRPPSEYFQDQVWMTFQDDPAGVQMLPLLPEDRVMWASDYPHPASTWPDSQAVIERQVGAMSQALRRKVVSDNARQLYRLSPGREKSGAD